MNDIDKIAYLDLFQEIKEMVYRSQYEALKAVNKELITLYWNIGKLIKEKQQEHGWGKSIVKTLSVDLQKEFPGSLGYSERNLWYMLRFHEHYSENKKLQPMVAEIGWTQNILILEKCKDDWEREFYLRMSKKYGWTKNILIHQMEGESYQRFLTNQTNFDKSLTEKYKNQAKLAVKDSYVFDFLEFTEVYNERELELGLLNNVRKFLLEMGSDFTFMGNQYKLTVDGNDFYVDLLLYHRRLKALVAIELKSGEFKPEHVGKMQFYLSVLDKTVKLEDENPSIGIIICKSKKRTIVEYALSNPAYPMGVAEYTIAKPLPGKYKELLPSVEEIVKLLSVINE